MAHEHYNVLRLEGPPGNGVNVGKAVDKWGEYSWEGEVVNNKANGFGRKTILSGKCLCHIAYGEFKDGEPWGSCVGKDPEGNTNEVIGGKLTDMLFAGQTIIFLYENGQYRGNDYYDSSNDCHKSTFENVSNIFCPHTCNPLGYSTVPFFFFFCGTQLCCNRLKSRVQQLDHW